MLLNSKAHVRHLVGDSLQQVVELSPQQVLHAASSLQRGEGMLAKEEIIISTPLDNGITTQDK